MNNSLQRDNSYLRRFILIAIPIIIQNGITNFVSNSNDSLDSNVLGVNYNGSIVENFYHPKTHFLRFFLLTSFLTDFLLLIVFP